MKDEIAYAEELLFKFIDEFKIIFYPEQWVNVFLECSKNEVLALLLIYRRKEVNMTEVAEYLEAPINTATGVINRLEKKQLVQRVRSAQDKRIVKISLTSQGASYFEEEKKIIVEYCLALNEKLSDIEKQMLSDILHKALMVLKEKGKAKVDSSKEEKRARRIQIE